MLEFSIATVSVFVGLLNQLVKFVSTTYLKIDINKYIPLFSIGFGLILGIIGYFTPNVEMGNNIVEAIFIGIASGASATGLHQIGKQFQKNTDDTVSEDDVLLEQAMTALEDTPATPAEEEIIDECDEDYMEDE